MLTESPTPNCPLCGYVGGGYRLEGNHRAILEAWLLGREHDIAQSWEDLGMLESVFQAVIGREPKETT